MNELGPSAFGVHNVNDLQPALDAQLATFH